MARRSGFIHTIARAQREYERQQKAQQREQTRLAREYEKAQRALEKAQIADAKERARLYVASRQAKVDLMNERLAEQISQLDQLLIEALKVNNAFNLDTLKKQPVIAPFDPGSVGIAEPPPDPAQYQVAALSWFQKLLPNAKAHHAQQVAEAAQRYEADVQAHTQREAERQNKLSQLRQEYERVVAGIRQRTASQHAEVEQLKQDYIAGKPHAITTYCSLVLEKSVYPNTFPQQAKLAYVPESKQLVVEYDLPSSECIPSVAQYKYVKSKDEISEQARPATQRKAQYASVVAQITLRTLYELFDADQPKHIDTIVFNGYVETIDRGTGQNTRICLVTVRTNRDTFSQLDLRRVDPAACLKVLNASVSKSPTELVPVRPVLEFSMVDPRFIEEADVLSQLDQRQNLMELTPNEFEALIANLFRAMGLETRLTQASRDGGVDCVAYDPRPIFGGKVVIQAKRYKHTVGVSAVRDLYGTVQNEGASKGILVTTSGYGKAAFDFANGKPLELLDGANLLHLLAEYTNIQARIEIPNDWKDPHPDSGT
jgi:restriction system protein